MIDNNENKKSRYELGTCPYCNSLDYTLFGFYKKMQRFRCKSCFKTFTARTNSPWHYSKKSDEHWKIFWNLQLEKTTIRKCSEVLKISTVTAFYWRHKLLNVLEDITKAEFLTNTVSMTKRVVNEVDKGAKAHLTASHKLWCIIAADENDHVFIKPISRDRWDRKAFNRLMDENISSYASIIPFGDRYLYAFTRKMNPTFADEIESDDYDYNDFLPFNAERVKSIVRKSFFKFNEIEDKAKGISTKYLGHYFALAKIFIQRKAINFFSVFYKSYNKSVYIKCREIKYIKLNLI